MPPFTILGMKVLRDPIPLASGEHLVASFTAAHGALAVSNIRLIAAPDGECRTAFVRDSRTGRIVVQGQDARTALLQAALDAYRARTERRAPADTPVATASLTVDTDRDPT